MFILQSVSLQLGSKLLLSEASVRFEPGQVTGLIGQNGTGKTSLLRLLQGELEEDAGELQCLVERESIAVLSQMLPDASVKVMDFVKTGDLAYARLQSDLMDAENANDGLKIAECYADLEAIGAYRLEADAAVILKGLGFQESDYHRSIGDFSGGWQMRLQLARVLLARSECLLLDEPTNHLDLEAITWLESWLKRQKKTIVLISHDRHFLDEVCQSIVHLSGQTLTHYAGNYSRFLRQSALDRAHAAAARQKNLQKIAHMQSFVDRFKAKASKAKQAQSRVKAIEKIALAPEAQEDDQFDVAFFEQKALPSPVLHCEGQLGYPDHLVFANVDLALSADHRIGLVGANGEGKSTLIKSLVGDISLLSGQVVAHKNLRIGYFSQQQLDVLDCDSTPMAHFYAQFPKVAERDARTFLGGYGFVGDRAFDKVGVFSGGEKARLALALLVYARPNFLLLDEPTNHLDLTMRESLIMALHDFTGGVIVVSHDRHFMDCVVDQLWWIHKGRVDVFHEGLDAYQKMVLEERSQALASKPSSPQSVAIDRRALKKEEAMLEKRLTRLLKEKKQLEQAMAGPQCYEEDGQGKLLALQSDLQKLEQKIAETEASWLHCSDQLGA